MAVVWKKLAFDSEVVHKSSFNANTILKADSDDTPSALVVSEQRLIGRITSGVINALTAAQVRTLVNVEDGADVTDSTNVESALGSINANALSDITSAGADIEDAVTKKHSANTDTQLDSGEVEVDADDCFKIKETAYFDAEYDNGNSGTAKTINWKLGNKQKLILNDNCTISFTAPSGPTNLLLKLVQDVTGSRTVTWPGTVKWIDGNAPTLSTGNADEDLVTLYFDGTNYYGQAALNFG